MGTAIYLFLFERTNNGSMKRFLLCILLVMTSVFLHAETKIGSYTDYRGVKYDIQASKNNKGELSVFIYCKGKSDYDKVCIRVDGENEINKLVTALCFIKVKLDEWTKVAEKNDIKSYQKLFSVDAPKVSIWFYSSDQWHCSFTETSNFQPYFLVGEENGALVHCLCLNGTTYAYNNSYMTQEFSLTLGSPEAVQDLADQITPQTVEDALIERNRIDSLFN